jgi:hypothetical protein
MDYIILDPEYENGRFNYFKGETGGPQYVVDPPLNTGLTFIKPTDEDPLVFSFMHQGEPYALACVVTTDMSNPNWDGRSTGRYFVCKPTIDGDTITWALTAGGTDGITLKVVNGEEEEEVAGNPHGVGQVDANLFIVDYDDDAGGVTNIYTVDIAALVGQTAGGDLTVTATPIPTANLPVQPRDPVPGEVFEVHGNGLIVLTDNSGNTPVAWLYAQYNGVIEDATTHMPKLDGYANGTVVRLLASDLSQQNQTSVTVGKNAMGLVPLPIPAPPPAPSGTVSGIALAVPCYGGKMQFGKTNEADSALYRIDDIFGTMTAAAAIVGEKNDVPSGATRDIKGVTFSDNGLFGYLLTVTYDAGDPIEMACWKIYQTTAADILGADSISISAAVNNALLVFLEGQDAAEGNDWEVLYENAANSADGRLWFVQGASFRVSQGSLYSVFEDFTSIWGDPDYPKKVGYINSADLIREMIYQYESGNSIETRLIKGKTVAKIARAAASAAPADEEDK